MRWRPLSRKAWVPMADVKCVLIHDNFQNFKSYNIPKAQLVIADIPYNIGMDFYASRPDWYVDGDNKNGESDKARLMSKSARRTANLSLPLRWPCICFLPIMSHLPKSMVRRLTASRHPLFLMLPTRWCR